MFLISDQHGNILMNEGYQERDKNKVIVEQPQLATSSGKPVKESRLKHFFSPIRKKVPPVQHTQNAQPDIFINNVLPSNMYVNPPQSNQYSILKKNRDSDPNTPSPTTSFQVRKETVQFWIN